MLELVISLSNGKQQQHHLEPGTYILGRGLTCDIRVADKSVARQHAIIEVFPDRQHIRSVGADNTLTVNGEMMNTFGPLRKGDSIAFGDAGFEVINSTSPPLPEDTVATPAIKQQVASESLSASKPQQPLPVILDDDSNESKNYAELTPLRKAIQEEIQTELDLHKRNLISEMSATELRAEAKKMAEQVVAKRTVDIPAHVDLSKLINEVVAESIGLGPIEPLLEDESITEVMVNGPNNVYVERNGRLTRAAVQFINDRSLMSAIERIVTPLGRRIDEGVPMVDARLADGSRVNAIIPPLALTGPTVTIRKFSKKRFDMNRLVEIGSLSPQMAEFLLICVEQRRNIVISGGTGSGKTTFLNALSDAIPDSERIVTIEDAAELRLAQRHVISLEARPANVEGKGHIAIRDLVRNSLRMRPDRIVVGECRGGEALDMLQAMNTGHDGSLTTGHANTPRDLLSRLEVMVLMSGMELPVRAIREQISSAVDIVVQQSRFKDGKRRVTDIVEVDGMEGDVVLTQKLFEFRQSGIGPGGAILGEFIGLQTAPKFYSEMEAAGTPLDRSIFDSTYNPDIADEAA